MNGDAKQHVVLCEGFDDRSFWRGWLLSLGCSDPTERGRIAVSDAWGRPVRGQGKYLFLTPAGSDVIVQPFHGRSNARAAALESQGGRQSYRPARVILNLDDDGDDDTGSSAEDQIRGIAEDLGTSGQGTGPFEIGGSLLYSVVWRCEDPVTAPGVPAKQTLERLVCAALRAAYPDRGPGVEGWLDAQPPGLKLPKSFGYSYFAKWYTDHGAMDFYECVWQDQAVGTELSQRLAATGAAAFVEAMVDD